ncbi:MAG: hypothetical protein ACRD5H_18650, partial [Nitrososphaerales archaeon]
MFEPLLPLPHTVKAILIHKATDLGEPGPDYKSGWGAINGKEAIDLVKLGPTNTPIRVDQVDFGQAHYFSFQSNGQKNLQATLVWDDPPAVRSVTTTLINDLNLRLIDPDQRIYLPYTLDTVENNYGNPAFADNDRRNNVEMVIGKAKAGQWEAVVDGTSVPGSSQQYTLIVSDTERTPPPPNTIITSHGQDSSTSGSGSFTFISTVLGRTFQCSIAPPSSEFEPCESPYTYSGLSNGGHIFRVKATDSVGNTDPTPAISSWEVTSGIPVTTITSHPPNPSNDETPSFSFESSGSGGSFECSMDSISVFQSCTSPIEYPLPGEPDLGERIHTFTVREVGS